VSDLKLELVVMDHSDYGKVAGIRMTPEVQGAARRLLPAAEKKLAERQAQLAGEDLLAAPSLRHPVSVLRVLAAGNGPVEAVAGYRALEEALEIGGASKVTGSSHVGVILDVGEKGIVQYVGGELLFHEFSSGKGGNGGGGQLGEVAEVKYQKVFGGNWTRWKVSYPDNLPDLETLLGADLEEPEAQRGVAR
jgi:hypothetical protein